MATLSSVKFVFGIFSPFAHYNTESAKIKEKNENLRKKLKYSQKCFIMKKDIYEGRKYRMIRLRHTSDLHLDSEFSCNDPTLTSLRI